VGWEGVRGREGGEGRDGEGRAAHFCPAIPLLCCYIFACKLLFVSFVINESVIMCCADVLIFAAFLFLRCALVLCKYVLMAAVFANVVVKHKTQHPLLSVL